MLKEILFLKKLNTRPLSCHVRLKKKTLKRNEYPDVDEDPDEDQNQKGNENPDADENLNEDELPQSIHDWNRDEPTNGRKEEAD